MAYDEQSLIAEIGGTMGLCVGASFLSVVEMMVAAWKKTPIFRNFS